MISKRSPIKPVATFKLTCPYCSSPVTCSLELIPLEFDQVHFTTCDQCRAGFTYFFDTITNVVYNGQPA